MSGGLYNTHKADFDTTLDLTPVSYTHSDAADD